jgi:hypothetical protein
VAIETEARPRPSSRPRSPRRRRAPWVYRVRRALLALLLVATVVIGWSLVTALRAPGDDVPTKLAEWARDHYLGPAVTVAEDIQYRLNPPQDGGTPDQSLLAAGAKESAAHPSTPLKDATALQSPVRGPVTPALPGEGVFVPAVTTSAGPLVQVTYVRPDSVHTSYLAGVAWLSHRLRFVLHPGYSDPGTTGMSQPSQVMPAQYTGLAATFNGGFKLKDTDGGYYDHGHTVGTLTTGAASFVVYNDGHATVGTWGSDVRMGPDVAFVRQNLKPLISGGTVAPNLEADVQSNWGTTVGGSLAVWRSGIGVTATGDLVYVSGDALSVTALADLLRRAGAVTAMQLDINKAWVSFMWYSHAGSAPNPHKLGDFQRPGDRYLSPTSRDFIAAYAA